MKSKICRFLANEKGGTAIEYAVLAAGIGMAIVLVVISAGSALQVIFTDVEASLSTGT